MTDKTKKEKSGRAKVLVMLICVLLVLMIVLLLLLRPSSGSIKQVFPEQDLGRWASVPPESWMSELSDDTLLCDIAMPGSHDSGTQYALVPFISRCQDNSIAEQLDMGIRALDIRLNTKAADGGYELSISHGFVPCKSSYSILSEDLSFNEVLSCCFDFLRANPTETIFMLLKHENGEGSAAELQTEIDKCVGENALLWYDEADCPTLEQARGKIVLARRYGEGESGLSGLDFCWEKQNGSSPVAETWAEHKVNDELSLWVQDRYEYETEDKWRAVLDCLSDSREGFSLNYLSTKGGKAQGIPKSYAKNLNLFFAEHGLDSDADLGVVFFDFVRPALAAKVYSTNKIG